MAPIHTIHIFLVMIANIQEFDTQYWVKTRASLNPEQSTFLFWNGSIYASIPGKKRKLLFNLIGVSISRCIPNAGGGWDYISRELNYYLDPVTNEVLERWENPWTKETVPIVQVINNPVQGYFKGKFPAYVDGDRTTFAFDIFPTYPNSLTKEPKFVEYSPQPTYETAEFFQIAVSTADLLDLKVKTVSKLELNWNRTGQWLPWMRMGKFPGYLIYKARGKKVNKFTQLPKILQKEINTHCPSYKEAPSSHYNVEGMTTSGIYFKQHFNACFDSQSQSYPKAG